MQKDFDMWNSKKKDIQQNKFTGFVNEREIWWCSLGLNIGDEEDGKNSGFERPVLVIKKFNRGLVLTIPLTTRIKNNPYYFVFIHDGVEFAAILSQLRLLSTKRFLRRIRKMNSDEFIKLKEGIKERVI
jgi:mRNA interferase MazF